MKIIAMITLFVVTSLAATAQISVVKSAYNNTLKSYFATKNALAKDNVSQANEGAKGLIENITSFPVKTLTATQQALWQTEAAAVKKAAVNIAAEKDIKEQRKAFWPLSLAMVKLAKSFNLNNEVVYVQYCPMAKKSWLNEVEAVQNPFYGSMMYDCGEVTETIARQ